MQEKKKILILGKLPPPYIGPAIATEIILNSKLKDNFQLLHLDTKANDSIETLGKWGLKKIFKNFNIYTRLFNLCLQNKPDLVLIPISQTTVGFLKDSLFIIIAKLTGRKILVQLRGSNFKNWVQSTSVFTRAFVKFVLSMTSGVIVLGRSLKYLFTDYFADKKIFVIPNGADYVFPVCERKTHAPVRILYLSNLLQSKGITDVFDALSRLKKKNIPFHFEAIGTWLEDPIRQYCLEQIKQHKLPADVYPSKGKNDKLFHLSCADIFLFPPREPEGHPWAIVEALAAGLPVISTDYGAITESVHDGINGFIVPSSDPDAIAEKLSLLIEKENLRIRMGHESRKIYLENFTEDIMIEKMSAVFRKIID